MRRIVVSDCFRKALRLANAEEYTLPGPCAGRNRHASSPAAFASVEGQLNFCWRA